MLTVAKIKGSQAAGYADYLEGKSTAGQLGDYYLKDGERVEAPGRWVMGASRVGAKATERVSGGQLRDLMQVRHPGTERPLRRAGGNGETVAALDATFSAPKSVSAIWAVGDAGLRAEIEIAQEQAVTRALAYSIKYVAMVRERVSGDEVIHTKAQDVVATSWRHSTARAVADQLPDPQLHSHVLLHAAVRRDGQIVAIDSRAWFVHRREIAAAYRTELAREMAALGFSVRRGTGRGGRYFELEGVPQDLMDRWSSRAHQVQEAIDANLDAKRQRLRDRIDGGGEEADIAQAQLERLEANGRLSPAEDRMLRVKTRTQKDLAVAAEDLDRAWMSTAAEVGFGPSGVTAARGRELMTLAPLDRPGIDQALTEFDATFMAREARAVVLEQSAGASYQETLAVLDVMTADGEVLMLADGSRTTDSHRETEHRVLGTAERLAENDLSPTPPEHVAHSAELTNRRLQEAGGQLSTEQAAALKLATGDRQIVMIEGQAGTGKSTVLQAIAGAHQQSGRQVIVTSTAGLAAQRLADDLDEAGVTAPAYSTAQLIHAVDSGRIELDPDTVLIHDEAALASTREQDRLLRIVEESGSRLIMVGDPEQSRPVGAGGLWTYMEHVTKDSEAHVELTQNLRARDPEDRDDQTRFRAGQHDQAVTGYADRGRVHLSEQLTEAETEALEAAHQDRAAGRSTIVIAQTSNDHLDELNAHAQALRIHDGQVGSDGLPVPGRVYGLRAGDHVQIRHSTHIPDGPVLRNGTAATIAGIDPRTRTAGLKLADGTEVQLDRAQIQAADVRLSYVQHPFPAQGVTTDTSHLIVAEHASRDGSYVAITRARDEAHIYAGLDTLPGDADTVPVDRLAQQMGREDPEVASIATPLASEPDQTPPKPEWRQAPGNVPANAEERKRWEESVQQIARYRNAHNIPDTDPRPLGPEPPAGQFRQRLERDRLVAFMPSLPEPPERTDDMGWEP